MLKALIAKLRRGLASRADTLEKFDRAFVGDTWRLNDWAPNEYAESKPNRIAYWSDPKESGDKAFGCKDRHLARLELEELRRSARWPLKTFNIGAGMPTEIENWFRGTEWVHYDLNVRHPSVHKGDIRRLPIKSGVAPAVLCRRVLTNLPPEDRLTAVSELVRILEPGGTLYLIDTFQEALDRVNHARVEAGMSELASPNISLQPETLGELVGAYQFPIAASYYFWTRVVMPRLVGRLLPYSSEGLRLAYPIMNDRACDLYGVHRLVMWEKP